VKYADEVLDGRSHPPRARPDDGAISTQVGPGITELTVTLVPLVVSAAPRAITSCADFEKP
jgi:hypothetical protein